MTVRQVPGERREVELLVVGLHSLLRRVAGPEKAQMARYLVNDLSLPSLSAHGRVAHLGQKVGGEGVETTSR